MRTVEPTGAIVPARGTDRCFRRSIAAVRSEAKATRRVHTQVWPAAELQGPTVQLARSRRAARGLIRPRRPCGPACPGTESQATGTSICSNSEKGRFSGQPPHGADANVGRGAAAVCFLAREPNLVGSLRHRSVHTRQSYAAPFGSSTNSSLRMSTQSSTHWLHMKTSWGPAITFATWLWCFPQNEQCASDSR
jgi:hypothetical protein